MDDSDTKRALQARIKLGKGNGIGRAGNVRSVAELVIMWNYLL